MKSFNLIDKFEGYIFINCVFILIEYLILQVLPLSKFIGLFILCCIFYYHIKIFVDTLRELKYNLNLLKVQRRISYIKCKIKSIDYNIGKCKGELPVLNIETVSLVDNKIYNFNLDYSSNIMTFSNDFIDVYLLVDNNVLLDVVIKIEVVRGV